MSIVAAIAEYILYHVFLHNRLFDFSVLTVFSDSLAEVTLWKNGRWTSCFKIYNSPVAGSGFR